MTARVHGSFRDPSGYLFEREGRLLRQVNKSYAENLDLLAESGLYENLVDRGLLIPHTVTDEPPDSALDAHCVIAPERVDFVSYPYEWCPSQLRDAALATLEIQRASLEHGMSLKDASAYNIQFHRGRPVLIDTLSFERYPEGRPWVAYRQFCQHFLAPAALMALEDVRLGQLLRIHIDGVPLDLASRLLPRRTLLKWSLLTHLHLHAASQSRAAGSGRDASSFKMSRRGFEGLIESLEGAIRGLKWSPPKTAWGDYYTDTNYSESAAAHKEELVADYLGRLPLPSVWDLGANTGRYSRIASSRGIPTVAFDLDAVAVERNYRAAREESNEHLLPLISDLANPSPAQGWGHRERMSLRDRGPAGAVLALALVHHLAIGNGVPLPGIVEFFRSLAPALIVEFVPKSDSQVQRLLSSREDVFAEYSREAFEEALALHFDVLDRQGIGDSERVLYLAAGK